MVNFMPPPFLRGRTKTIKVFLESASLLLLSSGQSASINVISIVHSRKIMAQGQGIWNTVKWMNCFARERSVLLYSNGAGDSILELSTHSTSSSFEKKGHFVFAPVGQLVGL